MLNSSFLCYSEGVEVRAGQPLKVQVEEDKLIHLSQVKIFELVLLFM
jgi:hypothetical protein